MSFDILPPAIPEGAFVYQSEWNALTNSPVLSDATGIAGHLCEVVVGGTQDLGSGPITFDAGDKVVHNGSVWSKWDMTTNIHAIGGGLHTASTIAELNTKLTDATLDKNTDTRMERHAFHIRPSLVASVGNEYKTWAELEAAMALVEGQKTVYVDEPFSFPAIPVSIHGANFVCSMYSSVGVVVTIPDGCTLDAIPAISNGIELTFTGTTSPIDGSASDQPVERGSKLICTSTGALVHILNGQSIDVPLLVAGEIGDGAHEVYDVDAGGSLSIIASLGCAIKDNAFKGAGDVSVYLTGGAWCSTTHPNFTGTLSIDAERNYSPDVAVWAPGLIQYANRYPGLNECLFALNFGGSTSKKTLLIDDSADLRSGTHDGGMGVATLVDSTQAWTINEFVGRVVRNLADGSFGNITANDATSITAVLQTGSNIWNTGDLYEIRQACWIDLAGSPYDFTGVKISGNGVQPNDAGNLVQIEDMVSTIGMIEFGSIFLHYGGATPVESLTERFVQIGHGSRIIGPTAPAALYKADGTEVAFLLHGFAVISGTICRAVNSAKLAVFGGAQSEVTSGSFADDGTCELAIIRSTPSAGVSSSFPSWTGLIKEENLGVASLLPYDNAVSGLTATDVQAAIDEVVAGAPSSLPAATATSAVALFATSSDTDVFVIGVTPGAGSWLVQASAMTKGFSPRYATISLYANGIQVVNTERHTEPTLTARMCLTTQAIVTVGAGEVIALYVRTDPGGAVEMTERGISVVKVNPLP